jgi:hypothetical protein
MYRKSHEWVLVIIKAWKVLLIDTANGVLSIYIETGLFSFNSRSHYSEIYISNASLLIINKLWWRCAASSFFLLLASRCNFTVKSVFFSIHLCSLNINILLIGKLHPIIISNFFLLRSTSFFAKKKYIYIYKCIES